ncbi:MAG: hypothetical protein QHH19_04805 [Candidatus Thermoplasmatota archaeon]|jgi:hypothetical protein|nr:hypothetical protein [Candidatus Thermoplasmatota archaeon]
MKLNRKMMILGVLLLVLNMTLATQYAVTKIGYEYNIVHPSDANIRFIGSDNTTGGRVLRVDGPNGTAALKLTFGNWSAGTNKIYSAAFGIVNEEQVPVNIMYINVSSVNYTYMKIWLHGNRTVNANDTLNDPTTVLMYDNGTIVNGSTTIAWTLAPGDNNPNNMCSNVSNRSIYSIDTPWDETQHVRYSLNNTNAYGIGVMGRTIDNASDFVWVQIAIDIPSINVDGLGLHTGTIWIHFMADTAS